VEEKQLKVKEVIERDIRPMLQYDGGDVSLIKIEWPRVFVRLKGMCAHCPSAIYTLKSFVEGRLKEEVSSEIEVVEG